MDTKVIDAIRRRVAEEAYARKLGLALRTVAPGYSPVAMVLNDDRAHGGAISSLINEAFERSCNAHGTLAIALIIMVTYHRPHSGAVCS
jgi:acyl-CoA thioesterase